MQTIQQMLLRLALSIDPRVKTGQIFKDISSAVSITNATNTTPIVVTAAGHGLQTGDVCFIIGVTGNTAANNTLGNPYWTVTVTNSSTFSLNSSVGNAGYTAGGSVVGALICSIEGNLEPQKLLNIYNDARYALFAAYKNVFSPIDLTRQVNGQIAVKTDLTFASGSANKPTGYIRPIYLMDAAGLFIPIVQEAVEPLLKPLQTLTFRYVIEEPGVLINHSGSTYIANAATYVLVYYGITRYSISDALGLSVGGVPNESFIDDDHTRIIELGEAISREIGTQELMALAKKLIGA